MSEEVVLVAFEEQWFESLSLNYCWSFIHLPAHLSAFILLLLCEKCSFKVFCIKKKKVIGNECMFKKKKRGGKTAVWLLLSWGSLTGLYLALAASDLHRI